MTENTFERLKVNRIHWYSFHISSVRLSALATGALIRAILLFSSSLGKHLTSNSEQKSATLVPPCLSVNIHISSYNMLRIGRLTLLIQHTNDSHAGLNGIKKVNLRIVAWGPNSTKKPLYNFLTSYQPELLRSL